MSWQHGQAAVRYAVLAGGSVLALAGAPQAFAQFTYSTNGAIASGAYSIAIGVGAETSASGAVAIGGDSANAWGTNSIALGSLSEARASGAVAVGGSAVASAAGAVAIGSNTVNNTANSVSLGGRDLIGTANGTFTGTVQTGTVAASGNATVGGTLGVTGATTLSGATQINNTLAVSGATTLNGATTINNLLTVNNTGSAIAINAGNGRIGNIANGAAATDAVAMGQLFHNGNTSQVQMGAGANASVANTVAVGSSAVASAAGAVAIGQGALSSGQDAIAIGTGATASGSVAVGAEAFAQSGGAAFGDGARATGANAAAIGPMAMASAANSVAIGANSVASIPNSVSFGSPGNERRLMNVAPAQARTDAPNFGQVQDMVRTVRNEARRGIAATAAMAYVPMPSAPGRTTFAMNGATFSGESGLGFSAAHRVDAVIPLMISGGFATGGYNDHVARIGFALEF